MEELQILYTQYTILFHQILNGILNSSETTNEMKECALKVNTEATDLDNKTTVTTFRLPLFISCKLVKLILKFIKFYISDKVHELPK